MIKLILRSLSAITLASPFFFPFQHYAQAEPVKSTLTPSVPMSLLPKPFRNQFKDYRLHDLVLRDSNRAEVIASPYYGDGQVELLLNGYTLPHGAADFLYGDIKEEWKNPRPGSDPKLEYNVDTIFHIQLDSLDTPLEITTKTPRECIAKQLKTFPDIVWTEAKIYCDAIEKFQEPASAE